MRTPRDVGHAGLVIEHERTAVTMSGADIHGAPLTSADNTSTSTKQSETARVDVM